MSLFLHRHYTFQTTQSRKLVTIPRLVVTHRAEEYTVGRGEMVDLFILLTRPAISCFVNIFADNVLHLKVGKTFYSIIEWNLLEPGKEVSVQRLQTYSSLMTGNSTGASPKTAILLCIESNKGICFSPKDHISDLYPYGMSASISGHMYFGVPTT